MSSGIKTKMKNKKAQITIFIAIAIVLVVSIGGYFIVKNQAEKQATENISPRAQVEAVVKQCLDENLLEAVLAFGFQGGYITPPSEYYEVNIEYISSGIGYSYYRGKNNFLTTKEAEEQISGYIDHATPSCLNQSQFAGFSISPGEAKSTTLMGDEEVSTNLNFPITITKENSTYKLETFSSSVPVRLGEIHSFAEGIINRTIQNPGFVPIDYLLNSGYNVSYSVGEDGTIFYTIMDDKSTIYETPYIYFLATKSE